MKITRALAWIGAALAPAALGLGLAVAAESPMLELRADVLHEDGVRLGRAALEQSLGHTDLVIEQLEGIDFSTEPAFAEADRAGTQLAGRHVPRPHDHRRPRHQPELTRRLWSQSSRDGSRGPNLGQQRGINAKSTAGSRRPFATRRIHQPKGR